MSTVIAFIALLLCHIHVATAQAPVAITYVSSADQTEQPAMFYAPESVTPVPLVVALHTWSEDYKDKEHKPIAAWCIKNGWAYIHPNFRGQNDRPEATGSDLVIQDIVDAVEYAQKATRIDASAIYLVGTSGGGYTALLMAGKHPDLWAGVSAWVPISDLRAWYFETKATGHRFHRHIENSCGGEPGASPNVDAEYRRRSPLTYLANANGVNLHINAGIKDGHGGAGPVPVRHSLWAFNELANPKDRLAESEIRRFVEDKAVPEHLQMELVDPSYGDNRPLFRRTSGNATITIFQGGHEILPEAAMSWISSLHRSK